VSVLPIAANVGPESAILFADELRAELQFAGVVKLGEFEEICMSKEHILNKLYCMKL
jgi:hypothetical protein